jgi:hypothetical protein
MEIGPWAGGWKRPGARDTARPAPPAKLSANEADEQSIEVAADRRSGVDHAGTTVVVEEVRRVESDLRLAVQAFNGHDREHQCGFDLLEGNGPRKRITVDLMRHRLLLGK